MAMAIAGLLAVTAVPALAQDDPVQDGPNSGGLTFSGGIDFLNRYMFRGIRQNSRGYALWPWFDVGIAAHAGEGKLKSASINTGVWNSLHTGDTGAESPSKKIWYEADFYATLGLGFGGGVSVSTTYTAYTSPNNTFSTIKEVMVRLAVDDSAYLGRAAVKPYVVVAQELDATDVNDLIGLPSQADAGRAAGTYMELGIAPGVAGSRVSLVVPVKVGLSLGNYYELDGTDHAFGYVSLAGILSMPIGSTTTYGAWNVHLGIEYQRLGDTTTFFNGGRKSQGIVSVGLGFSY